MSEFLHKLAEGLRTREKLLEDHAATSVFDKPEGDKFKQEFDALMEEIKDFQERVEKAKSSQKDFEEHFEQQINDDCQQLAVKIDTWRETVAH
jgi:uncharacterized protein YwgA